jgi:hypothetical protein
MNIGVFGDSFCDKLNVVNKPSWFELLKEFNHNVISYGEPGSSILFSAKLIEQHYQKFDFIIWCVTDPNRITVSVADNPTHFNAYGLGLKKVKGFDELSFKTNIIADWFKYILDPNEASFTGQALVSYMSQKHQNLMIIPCFSIPLDASFCLCDVSNFEIEHYFSKVTSGPTMLDWAKKYKDIRRCHLSTTNNQLLASAIESNLHPGVVDFSYTIFQTPNECVTECFEKIKEI